MSNLDYFAAIKSGDLDTVSGWLERDPALIELRDDAGATALHYAAFNGDRKLVRLLVDKGAKVNSPDDEFGATATGWAIEYLRELGGVLTVEIEDLVFAIDRHDSEWVARLLSRFPALREQVDPQGMPLKERAKNCGNEEIARLFETKPAS